MLSFFSWLRGAERPEHNSPVSCNKQPEACRWSLHSPGSWTIFGRGRVSFVINVAGRDDRSDLSQKIKSLPAKHVRS